MWFCKKTVSPLPSLAKLIMIFPIAINVSAENKIAREHRQRMEENERDQALEKRLRREKAESEARAKEKAFLKACLIEQENLASMYHGDFHGTFGIGSIYYQAHVRCNPHLYPHDHTSC
jgi:hypothetical protein